MIPRHPNRRPRAIAAPLAALLLAALTLAAIPALNTSHAGAQSDNQQQREALLVIDRPGPTTLDRDLDVRQGVGVLITADGAHLDLARFTITLGPEAHAAVRIAPGVRGAAVRNGRVIGTAPPRLNQPAQAGIHGPEAHMIAVSDMVFAEVPGPAIDLGPAATVESVRVDRCGVGVRAAWGARVSDLLIYSCDDAGAHLGERSAISNATILGCGGVGVRVGSASHVDEVTTCNNAEGLVAGRGSRVSDTIASSNLGDGIRASYSSAISGVVCEYNGAAGLTADDGSLIADSVANDNTADGMRIGKGVAVTGSAARSNYGLGVRQEDGSPETSVDAVQSNNTGR